MYPPCVTEICIFCLDMKKVKNMVTDSFSTPFHDNLENSLVKALPMGTLVYPLDTKQTKEQEKIKKVTRKEKIEILHEVKKELKKVASNFIIKEKIPIPERFTIDDIMKQWGLLLDSYFEKWENILEEKKSKLHKEEEKILETLVLVRRMEQSLENKDTVHFKSLIDDYAKAVKMSFEIYYGSLDKLRTSYGKIFLESNLPPEFMTYTNKLVNTLISYLNFLESILTDVQLILGRLVRGRGTLEHFKKDTNKFFSTIEELDVLQYTIINELFKLEFYMDIWHSESPDDLFKTKKSYTIEKLDIEYFSKAMKKLDKLSTNFHIKIIKSSIAFEKVIPNTLSSEQDEIDEKLTIMARMLHT